MNEDVWNNLDYPERTSDKLRFINVKERLDTIEGSAKYKVVISLNESYVDPIVKFDEVIIDSSSNDYVIKDVPYGMYNIEITCDGYKKYKKTVRVNAKSTIFPIKLEPWKLCITAKVALYSKPVQGARISGNGFDSVVTDEKGVAKIITTNKSAEGITAKYTENRKHYGITDPNIYYEDTDISLDLKNLDINIIVKVNLDNVPIKGVTVQAEDLEPEITSSSGEVLLKAIPPVNRITAKILKDGILYEAEDYSQYTSDSHVTLNLKEKWIKITAKVINYDTQAGVEGATILLEDGSTFTTGSDGTGIIDTIAPVKNIKFFKVMGERFYGYLDTREYIEDQNILAPIKLSQVEVECLTLRNNLPVKDVLIESSGGQEIYTDKYGKARLISNKPLTNIKAIADIDGIEYTAEDKNTYYFKDNKSVLVLTTNIELICVVKNNGQPVEGAVVNTGEEVPVVTNEEGIAKINSSDIIQGVKAVANIGGIDYSAKDDTKFVHNNSVTLDLEPDEINLEITALYNNMPLDGARLYVGDEEISSTTRYGTISVKTIPPVNRLSLYKECDDGSYLQWVNNSIYKEPNTSIVAQLTHYIKVEGLVILKGDPAVGATVTYFDKGVPYTATTDAKGHVSFICPSGMQVISASIKDEGLHQGQVTIDTKRTNNFFTIYLQTVSAAKVRVVVKREGSPVAGAKVFSKEGLCTPLITESDGGGDTVVAGHKQEFIATKVLNGVLYINTATVDINPSLSNYVQINLIPQNNITVEGTVKLNGEPVEYAEVTYDNWGFVKTVIADKKGHVSFKCARCLQEFTASKIIGDYKYKGKVLIDTLEDQSFNIDLAYTISGTATKDGLPLVNIPITSKGEKLTYTDTEGNFLIKTTSPIKGLSINTGLNELTKTRYAWSTVVNFTRNFSGIKAKCLEYVEVQGTVHLNNQGRPNVELVSSKTLPQPVYTGALGEAVFECVKGKNTITAIASEDGSYKGSIEIDATPGLRFDIFLNYKISGNTLDNKGQPISARICNENGFMCYSNAKNNGYFSFYTEKPINQLYYITDLSNDKYYTWKDTSGWHDATENILAKATLIHAKVIRWKMDYDDEILNSTLTIPEGIYVSENSLTDAQYTIQKREYPMYSMWGTSPTLYLSEGKHNVNLDYTISRDGKIKRKVESKKYSGVITVKDDGTKDIHPDPDTRL